MSNFNVRLLYVYKFMSQCLPIYAFYTILFINRGMSVSDIAVLMALWSTFAIIFEIPSGVLADRWNRRNMMMIAAALQGLCFIVWFFAHTLPLFAAGFALWAASEAFVSGTEEGLIYDNLKSDGTEEHFTRVYGRARFCMNAGMVVGIVSAGIIANFISIEYLALLSAGICFFNVILVMQIREKNYYSERLGEAPVRFSETFKEAAGFIKGSPTAWSVLLFLVLFVAVGSYLDEFDALIINDFGLSNIWVSAILTVRFAFTASGDLLVPFVQKKITSIRQIFMIDGIAFALLTVFAVMWNRCALLVFGLTMMLLAVSEVLLVNMLQQKIKEEGRATVMSFYGIGQNLVMICFSLLYGGLAGVFSLQQVYVIISLYGIAGSLGFILFRKRLSN